MAGSSHTFAPGRLATYILLWIVSVILLGLTAYRIHFTRTIIGRSHFYESIIVELLVCSILAIIWVPIIAFLIASEPDQHRDGAKRSRLSRVLTAEAVVLFILWIMWLVGAAYTTNRILPGRNYCRTIRGRQCNTLTSVLAFAWTGFSLLTILFILTLMHLLSAHKTDTNNGVVDAKSRAYGQNQHGMSEAPVGMPSPNPGVNNTHANAAV